MNRKKIIAGALKKLSTKNLYHTTHIKNLKNIMEKGLVPSVGKFTEMGHGLGCAKLIYFLDTPLPSYHEKDSVVLEIKNLNNYDIYKYDGYGVQELNGKYYDPASTSPDILEIPPKGVEEGDYYTEDTVLPEDIKVVK